MRMHERIRQGFRRMPFTSVIAVALVTGVSFLQANYWYLSGLVSVMIACLYVNPAVNMANLVAVLILSILVGMVTILTSTHLLFFVSGVALACYVVGCVESAVR